MRVVIADDSVLLREGIVRLLDEAGFEVVGQAGDAEDLLRKVGAHKPDVASSTSACRRRTPTRACARRSRSAASCPDRGCSCSRSTSRRRYALELLGDAAEGVGYLLKDRVADVDAFLDAVRRVAEGGSALDPEVVSQLLGRARARRPAGRR